MINTEFHGVQKRATIIAREEDGKIVHDKVITEIPLIRTYSDKGYLIRNVATGETFESAVDPEGSGREYEETDELIGGGEDEITAEEFYQIMEEIV